MNSVVKFHPIHQSSSLFWDIFSLWSSCYSERGMKAKGELTLSFWCYRGKFIAQSFCRLYELEKVIQYNFILIYHLNSFCSVGDLNSVPHAF